MFVIIATRIACYCQLKYWHKGWKIFRWKKHQYRYSPVYACGDIRLILLVSQLRYYHQHMTWSHFLYHWPFVKGILHGQCCFSAIKWTVDLQVIWDTMTFRWCHCIMLSKFWAHELSATVHGTQLLSISLSARNHICQLCAEPCDLYENVFSSWNQEKYMSCFCMFC